MVACVGEHSSRDKEQQPQLETDVDTPLQGKLKNLSSYLTKYSIYACAGIFLVMITMMIIQISTYDSTNNTSSSTGVLFARLSSILNFVIVLAIVAIPEGLPLAVSMSLAFSVMKMHKDKLLVRKLDAPEKMGAIDELLVGKTGTITTAEMKVVEFYCENRLIKNTRKNTLLNCELNKETLDLIYESILFNCEARVEMDDFNYIPVGNPTETALLRFLQDADIPIHLLIKKKYGKIRAALPFSSTKKRSVTVVQHPSDSNLIRIYLKGAPEVVQELCTQEVGLNS